MEMDHVIVVLKQICDEYKASTASVEKIVEKFDSLNQISGRAKQVLCDTAHMLQTSVVDINPTDFLLQQTKLALEESRMSKKRLQLQNTIHQLAQRDSGLKHRTEELLRDMQVVKKEYEGSKETMEGKVIETQFIEHQIEKYKKELETLKEEEKLMDMLDPEQFKDLQERVKAIAEMKTNCDTLKLKLEKHEGLPPDLEQAQEVLAQTISKHKEGDKHMKAQILNQGERVASVMTMLSEHPA